MGQFEIDEQSLHWIEEEACKSEGTANRTIRDLVSYVRALKHQLADPNYSYPDRIHRQAIITRDAEIVRLREQLKKAQAERGQLPQQVLAALAEAGRLQCDLQKRIGEEIRRVIEGMTAGR